MHNYHSRISRSPIYCNTTFNDISITCKRVWNSPKGRILRENTRNSVLSALTTLAITGIFLGGTYLFLSQLANHGW